MRAGNAPTPPLCSGPVHLRWHSCALWRLRVSQRRSVSAALLLMLVRALCRRRSDDGEDDRGAKTTGKARRKMRRDGVGNFTSYRNKDFTKAGKRKGSKAAEGEEDGAA